MSATILSWSCEVTARPVLCMRSPSSTEALSTRSGSRMVSDALDTPKLEPWIVTEKPPSVSLAVPSARLSDAKVGGR